MGGFDGKEFADALGVILAGFVIAIGAAIRGIFKGDGKPPEERAMTPHETKAALEVMSRNLEAAMAMGRAISDDINRHHGANTDKLNRITNELEHIKGELDDAKQERRIEDAFRRRDRT